MIDPVGAATKVAAAADGSTLFVRLELKYLIDEAQASRVREEARPYCDGDPSHRPPYLLTSLYLDTHSLEFHRARLRNDPERVKLRVRTYGSSGDAPVFLEIKRKTEGVIVKHRAEVPADSWPDYARGFGDRPLPARDRDTVDRFAWIQAVHGAEPRLLMRYEREAWSSTVDRYARITFDRCIEVREAVGWDLDGGVGPWIPVDQAFTDDGIHSPVVLEVKCETRVPSWCAALLRRNELRRVAFSKYSNGMVLLDRELRSLPPLRFLDELADV